MCQSVTNDEACCAVAWQENGSGECVATDEAWGSLGGRQVGDIARGGVGV